MKKITLLIFLLLSTIGFSQALVTFKVDMSNYVGLSASSTVNLNGSFNGWCGACNPMVREGSTNIWSTTLPLPPGPIEYKFTIDGWNSQENLISGSSCTVTNSGFTNRSLLVDVADVTVPTVCWESCSSCATTIPNTDVTFKVDMSNYVGLSPTSVVNINGTFNGWCGSCNALVKEGATNIWSTTLSIPPGSIEYKFTIDGWNSQENLISGTSCTVTNSGFTNRSLVVGSTALTAATVCWESCSSCSIILPLIQDFEAPVTYTSLASFSGASASVVADPVSGGVNGQVLSGTQGPGGDPWQGIEFVQTEKKSKLTTNKLMTVDVYCSQAFSLLAKVEQGGTGPISATGQSYTTPGQWQTLTFNFAVPMDNSVVANGEYQKIIFFGNWKSTNDGWNSPIVPLTFYIDNVRSEEAPVVPISDPAPLVAAPTPPARNSWDVISLFSNAYSDITISDWAAGLGWGGGAPITDLQITGNDTKKIAFGNFIGVDFGAGHHIDATNMTDFHMDFWVPSTTDLVGKVLNPKFSAWTSDTSGETSSFLLTYLPSVNGTWASIDAPISTFTSGNSNPNIRNNVAQFLVSSNLGLVYVDNIYLYRPATMATDSFNSTNVKLYPNPTSTSLTIEAKDAIDSVIIYNVLGQQVISKNPMSNTMTMDVSNLENGLYFVNSTIDGKSSTTKFIKN